MKIVLISTSTTASDQGIRTVSSCLKQRGHEIKILFLAYSEDYKRLYPKKVIQQIKCLCKTAQLIGISSYASTAKRAVQVIEALKPLNIPIVWGGVHATLSPEDCIRHCNIVCIGEGEEAAVELADAIQNKTDYANIKNLWVKKENLAVTKNPPGDLIQNLDRLPIPDQDIAGHYILKRTKIVPFKESDFNGYIFFLTGRGCPYSCTYCSNKKINFIYEGKWGAVRTHSPRYIISTIKYLTQKYKSLKIFDIRDDTFSFRSIDDIREFCDLYKKEVGLRFKCLGDPKTISEEKVKLLVDAGCTDIIIGIQGVERVNREIYQRHQTDEQVLNAGRILNKFKDRIRAMYDVIACNPYETSEDIMSMIKLLQKIPKPYYLSINNLVFFTGSALYSKAKSDGISYVDKTAYLNYWDRWQHIRLKKKNMYLNLVLNLMRGAVTEKRFGVMPNLVLNFLLKPGILQFNLRYTAPSFFVGTLVGFSDFIREKIAKPVYRNLLPTGFKVWYDKARYRI